MKKSILTLAAVALGFTMNAQTYTDSKGIEIFHIDSLFEDASNLLLSSQVVEVTGVNQAEIKRRILNFAGLNFRDVSEVLVSESDDQLVFQYVEEVLYKTLGMVSGFNEYVRLVIQIKDEKYRILAYDDGNAFIAGSYTKYSSVPATPAHSIYFNKRFVKGIIKNKGMYKPQFQMIDSFYKGVNSTVSNFAEAGKNSTSNEEVVGASDNW